MQTPRRLRTSRSSSAIPFHSREGLGSNAPGIAPHPVYFASVAFSSGVARTVFVLDSLQRADCGEIRLRFFSSDFLADSVSVVIR